MVTGHVDDQGRPMTVSLGYSSATWHELGRNPEGVKAGCPRQEARW
jgi:hypothetical protein